MDRVFRRPIPKPRQNRTPPALTATRWLHHHKGEDSILLAQVRMPRRTPKPVLIGAPRTPHYRSQPTGRVPRPSRVRAGDRLRYRVRWRGLVSARTLSGPGRNRGATLRHRSLLGRPARRPLEVPARPSRTTVLHAGREDIRICYFQAGRPPANVFDLQLAAGLVGLTYPIGYAGLVLDLLGQRMTKGQTLTDWRRRPLSPRRSGMPSTMSSSCFRHGRN